MTEQVIDQAVSLQNQDEPRILFKHSASIQITNRISMLARRISNVLLANARRSSPTREMHEIEIAELRRQIHYNSRNTEHLYSAIESLFATRVRYNLFHKDSNTWGELHLLAEYQITDDRVLRYAYPPSIRSRLMSPNLYARLDLTIQNLLGSKHSLAMWEYLTDALGSKRSEATVVLPMSDFRELMNLDPGEYEDFSDLNKRILRRAIDDLNEHTKLRVQLDVRRKGRKPDSLVFRVTRAIETDSALLPSATNDSCLGQGNIVAGSAGGTECHASNELCFQLTREFGISDEMAAQICRTYGADEIWQCLERVRAALKKRKIENVPAYTMGALRRNLSKTTSLNHATGHNSAAVDVPMDCTKLSDGGDSGALSVEAAELWYAGLDSARQQRLKDLFIAGLSGHGMNPVQNAYLKDGPNHPMVHQAFMLHIARKLSRQYLHKVGEH